MTDEVGGNTKSTTQRIIAMRLFLPLIAISVLLLPACQSPSETADLILTGAQVITLAEDGSPQSGEGVAFKDGRVIFVGTKEECQA